MLITEVTLTLSLCLLLRKVCGGLPAEHQVEGLANHSATLPCSFIIPANWRDSEAHVIWYQNLTHKILECTVREEERPVCQKSPGSSRMQMSWKSFGSADLDIDGLQPSDSGQYQCWVILHEAYQRHDTLLRVYDHAGPEVPPQQRFVSLNTKEVVSVRNILLIGGWLTTLVLAGVLLSQRRRCYRKNIYTII